MQRLSCDPLLFWKDFLEMLYSKEETKKRESKVLNSYKTFMMMVQEEIVVLENHSFKNSYSPTHKNN